MIPPFGDVGGARDGQVRTQAWLLPVIREQLARDGDIRRSAAVVASWARYAEGTDEQGQPIEIADRLKETLMTIARNNRKRPTAFIENRQLFGDLADDERFRHAYLEALERLHTQGARATVEALVAR